MASTTALLTGLSGLTVNSRRLDVIGNNIANVNTTAYKSNRMLFSPTFARTLSSGTGPSAASGGTNPTQVGLGASVAGTQRNFGNGAINTTGVPTDLALEGKGLFIVKRGTQQYYTRNGAFQLTAERDLATITGERVQGYGVDSQFNIVPGTVKDINIPIGSLTIAEATTRVNFAGNLNAGGALPTQGSNSRISQPWVTTAAAPLTTASLMTTLADPSLPAQAFLNAGNLPYTLTISGAQKGGKTLPDRSLPIDAATTVQDVLTFLNNALGIVPGQTNPDGRTSGAQIDALGNVEIIGNAGAANNVVVENTDIRWSFGAPPTNVPNPFNFTQAATGDGESVRTGFIVYDSLGTAVNVDVTMVLDSKSNAGTRWRYYVDSQDNTVTLPTPPAQQIPAPLNIGTGLIDFDTAGRLATSQPISVSVNRENTGAVTPLTFSINLSSGGDNVTALADGSGGSNIAAVFQNGSALGVLSNFSVGGDGVITGAFSNGLTRDLGQVAVAMFTNFEGLVDSGNNLFSVGPNSGTPLVTQPQRFGAGRLVGGALEQSNVDLGQEFIDLVLTSTGYSAASRVITTSDQLLQQLIAIGR